LVSVLNSSKAGLIYKNDSPTDFAEKLQYLLENKNLWEEFGEKGYQSILTEFNWDNTSKPIVKLYHSI
jgi:glycosyltransferase involved in cell wall biosynthesis